MRRYVSKVLRRIWRPVGMAIDSLFDLRYGIRTAGYVPTCRLGVPAEQTKDCIWYQPSPAKGVMRLISSLGVDLSRFLFVDLGAGRGRVLILAARFPFRAVIGVEFSPVLCEEARENLRRAFPEDFRVGRISIICEDARTFVAPEGDLCVFLFTPFKGEVLSSVLTRLRQHWQKGFRVIILYCGKSRPVIEALDSLRWPRRQWEMCLSWSDLRRYNLLVYDSAQAHPTGATGV